MYMYVNVFPVFWSRYIINSCSVNRASSDYWMPWTDYLCLTKTSAFFSYYLTYSERCTVSQKRCTFACCYYDFEHTSPDFEQLKINNINNEKVSSWLVLEVVLMCIYTSGKYKIVTSHIFFIQTQYSVLHLTSRCFISSASLTFCSY